MAKIEQDNDMVDLTSLVYTKKEIELLWPIGSGSICNKNKTKQ